MRIFHLYNNISQLHDRRLTRFRRNIIQATMTAIVRPSLNVDTSDHHSMIIKCNVNARELTNDD